LKDGKKDIGSIFCLEKLNRDNAQPKEVRLESLNHFGNDILNFYEIGDANDEEAPLANSTSRLRLVVNELM
jgi:hypothetical protein